MDRDPILVEREKTHGSFDKNAVTYIALKEAFGSYTFNKKTHALALDMIFVKLSRLAQNPDEIEHWRDLSGYAKLGEEACK